MRLTTNHSLALLEISPSIAQFCRSSSGLLRMINMLNPLELDRKLSCPGFTLEIKRTRAVPHNFFRARSQWEHFNAARPSIYQKSYNYWIITIRSWGNISARTNKRNSVVVYGTWRGCRAFICRDELNLTRDSSHRSQDQQKQDLAQELRQLTFIAISCMLHYRV